MRPGNAVPILPGPRPAPLLHRLSQDTLGNGWCLVLVKEAQQALGEYPDVHFEYTEDLVMRGIYLLITSPRYRAALKTVVEEELSFRPPEDRPLIHTKPARKRQ
jgi:hypothetical protein